MAAKPEPTPPHSTPAPTLEDLESLRRQVAELQRVGSLGLLAGGICHELNNALTPVLSYAKLGQRNLDPEFRRRAFERIEQGARRAAAIAGGALGLARPGSGRRAPTDLVELARGVLLLATKDLQKHRVRLDFQAEGRPHARVAASEIQQVLLNLVINARQAMPGGGALTVRVGQDASGKLAELGVSDTGGGIAPADLRRIFEPFFTTKPGPDAGGLGGTGLGLSICREIVEAHRGRLRAESRVGHGTTFTLRLPSCPAPEPSTSTAPIPAPGSSRPEVA